MGATEFPLGKSNNFSSSAGLDSGRQPFPFASQSFSQGIGRNKKISATSGRTVFNIFRALCLSNNPGILPDEVGAALGSMDSQLQGGKTFYEAFGGLTEAQKVSIGKKIGKNELGEFLSLSQNPDPEMFWEELLQFGSRLELAGKTEQAATVYSGILAQANNSPSAGIDKIRTRVEERYHAILGKGDFGARFEFLASRFVHEATDYRVIVPMLGASVVGQTVGTAILGRFAGAGSEAWYARGLSARLLAGSGGYLAEFPTFALAGRALSGGGQDGDFSRAAITLGALKVFGAAGNQAFRKFHGISEGSAATRLAGSVRFSQAAFSQTAMFGGLMVGHKLEEKFGLRPHTDGATTVTDTLASMVSLGVGSHLGHRLLGPGFHRFQQELVRRSELYSRSAKKTPFLFGDQETGAVLVALGPQGGRNPLMPQGGKGLKDGLILAMSNEEGGPPKGPSEVGGIAGQAQPEGRPATRKIAAVKPSLNLPALVSRLQSLGRWDSLPEELRQGMQDGRIQTWDQAAKVFKKKSSQGDDSSPDAKVGLQVLWQISAAGGKLDDSILRRLPPAHGLREAIQRRVRAHLAAEPEQIELYEAALEGLRGGEGEVPILTAIYLGLNVNPEEGLELLTAFRELALHQNSQKNRAAARGVTALLMEAPHLAEASLRLLESLRQYSSRIGQLSVAEIDHFFSGVQSLAWVAPEVALSVIENLTAKELLDHWSWKTNYRSIVFNFVKTLDEIGRLDSGKALIQAMEPFLEEYLGGRWKSKGPEREGRINKALRFMDLVGFFLEYRDLPHEAANLIRAFLTHPDGEGKFREFSRVHELAQASRRQVLAAFRQVVDQLGPKEGPQVILDYFNLYSLFMPEPLAAKLATHPGFFGQYEKEALANHPSRFILPLLDISFVPEVQRQFFDFIERASQFPGLGPPHRYLEVFGEMALWAMEGNPGREPQLPKSWQPEEVEAFRKILQEIQVPSANPSLPASPPGEIKISEEVKGFPRPADAGMSDSEASDRNHALLLKQNRLFVQLTQAEPGGPRTLDFARHFLTSLVMLPSRRHAEDRLFFRTDLALNVLRLAGFPEDQAPPLLGILGKDLEEIVDQPGDNRGIDLGRWILRMEQMQFPERTALIESVLQAAITPPPRKRLNPRHPSGEHAALETIHSLLSPEVQEVLASTPLSEKGRRLYEKMLGMAKRFAMSRKDPEGEQVLTDIEGLFYSNPQGEEADLPEEIRKMLQGGSSHLLNSGEGSTPEGSPGIIAPEPLLPSSALARIAGGGLMAHQLSANPQTGLMEIDIGGGTRLAIWHAVAPVRSEEVAEVRRDWHQRAGGSLEEAQQELNDLDKEYSQTDSRALIPRATATALELASRLEAVKGADSFKMMMQSRLGEDPEEAMLAKIAGAMSVRHGLDMLEMAIKQGNGHSVLSLLKAAGKVDPSAENLSFKDVRDLNRFSPDVTTMEVALASLAEQAPRTLVTERGVPMPYRITVSGIEWANDDYDPQTQRHGLFPIDPYQYIGVTGASLGTEYTHFNSWVSRLIKTALKTQLTDRYLFNHLYRWHQEANIAGLKMLKAEGDPRRLLNKEVIDVDHHRPFRPSETTRLIGLLEKVPQCLNTDQPARIYFKPFAGGILFLNLEGQPVEYVSYHPHLQRTGFQEIHYTTEADLSDDNKLAHQFLGNKLTHRLYEAALDQAQGEGSLLEDKILDVQSKFLVALPLTTRSTPRLPEGEGLFKVDSASIKMGVLELEALENALSSIHPFVWRRAREGRGGEGGISIIRKDHSPHASFLDWSQNAGELGFYDPTDRSIHLYHMQGQPYHRLDEVGRQLWHDTVLHEVGEAWYESMTSEEKEDFVSIYPWRTKLGPADAGAIIPTALVVQMVEDAWQKSSLTPAFPDQELPKHLLSSYMSSNPRDLFSEAFMAYVAHGPEFREKAKASPYLQKIYDWLKTHVFTTPEGVVEHTASPPVGLARLEQSIGRWREEMRRKGLEKDLEQSHEEAKAAVIGEIIESPEEAREKEIQKEKELVASEMEGTGGFVGAYYAMAMMDEAGRQIREVLRTNPIQDLPEWEQPVVEAMAKALKEDVFGAHSGVATKKTALIIWERMLRGNKAKALDALRKKIEKVQNEFGDALEFENDEGEVMDLLIEVAQSKLGEASPLHRRLAMALSEFVLPGQFTAEDLGRFHGIANDSHSSDIEVIRKFYEFVLAKGNWVLNPDQKAQLTAQLAAAATHLGKALGANRVFGIIKSLKEGQLDLYKIAELYRLDPGEIDAFAERFLSKEDYDRLQGRSEREGLKQNLRISLEIHLALRSEFGESFPGEETPKEIEEGIQKLKLALDALESQDPQALEQAKKILSDRGHSARMDEFAREIFRRVRREDL